MTANISTHEAVFSRVDDLAAQAAAGEDALPLLGQNVAQWAHEGAISPRKPKEDDANQTDDVRDIFQRYMSGAGKAEFARSTKSNTTTGQVSKLRVFAIVGARTDLDGPDFFARTCERRAELKASNVKVKPAYDAMISAGRLVGKEDRTDLTPEEMDLAVRSPIKGESTALSIYRAIDKAMGRMIKQKIDTSDATMKIRRAVSGYLSKLEADDKLASWAAEGERLGIKAPLGFTPTDDDDDAMDDAIDAMMDAA